MRQTDRPRQNAELAFPLAPLHRMTTLVVVALWLILLLMGFLTSSQQQPPHNPVPWWLPIVFGTALVPVILLSLLAHRSLRLVGDTLQADAAWVFGRNVPIAELDLDKACVLDLDEHTGYKPMLRLWGFGLPRFHAGNYLLRNRSRAFCLLTRQQQVLLLPQRNGKTLLLSPDKPQAMLDALRQRLA